MLYFQNYFLICWKHKIIFILFIYFFKQEQYVISQITSWQIIKLLLGFLADKWFKIEGFKATTVSRMCAHFNNVLIF